MVDIPEMVNDTVRGCGQTWIGPENTTVNEVFVSDLYNDTHQREVVDMFMQDRPGGAMVTPSKVAVKPIQSGNLPRAHAFVS